MKYKPISGRTAFLSPVLSIPIDFVLRNKWGYAAFSIERYEAETNNFVSIKLCIVMYGMGCPHILELSGKPLSSPRRPEFTRRARSKSQNAGHTCAKSGDVSWKGWTVHRFRIIYDWTDSIKIAARIYVCCEKEFALVRQKTSSRLFLRKCDHLF